MKKITLILSSALLLFAGGCSEYSNFDECHLKELQKCAGVEGRECATAARNYCIEEYVDKPKPKKKTKAELQIAKQEQEKRAKERKKQEAERVKLQKIINQCIREEGHQIYCLGTNKFSPKEDVDFALMCSGKISAYDSSYKNYYYIFKGSEFTWFDLEKLSYGKLNSFSSNVTTLDIGKNPLRSGLINRETLMSEYSGSDGPYFKCTKIEKEGISERINQMIDTKEGKNKI